MSDGAERSPQDEVWSVRRLLQWTTQFLAKKGIEKPELDASLLLAHALNWKRIELYARADDEPSAEQRQSYRDLIRRRSEGCPVAYLVGHKEFFTLEFEVTPAVLIPRDDSEWLVSECLKLAKSLPAPRILDVGTGSGCLAVAVALKQPKAQVTAIDISPEALAVANRNAARHRVSERLLFLEGDLISPLPPGSLFDLVISNPPYIRHDDIARLDRDVRDFEPHLALDGGADGFAVFDRLIQDVRAVLEPGASLLIEIGAEQESDAQQRLRALPGYEVGKTIRDLAGRPRVITARWIGA